MSKTVEFARMIEVPVGKMVETKSVKMFRSDEANFNFNKVNGFTQMWGKTKDDDVEVWPFPNILDIEITTVCNGPDNKLCSFCYKGNNPNGYNMPFEHFKTIIDKMPWLQQTALGADAQGVTNPDMFKMMEYARQKGIVPNLTIADVSEEVADKLAKVAGAVAVSVYKHAGYDVAFDSIARLIEAGKRHERESFAINIHYMISSRTIEGAYKVIDAYLNDPRLKGMGAVVFLGLKAKGRGKKFDTVTREQYKALVDYCLEHEVRFGFDSCSGPAFIDSVKGHEKFEQFAEATEPCESLCLSSYINEYGQFFPCSFTEGEGNWKEGINVLESEDFVTDVWNHPRSLEFRNMLIGNKDENGCRNCPVHIVCDRDMRQGSFKPAQIGDIL
ncbi:MAG: SPASM domain-containing protein [Bacilli bacterium]